MFLAGCRQRVPVQACICVELLLEDLVGVLELLRSQQQEKQ